MSIVRNIINNIKKLTKDILTLRARLRLLEVRLNNIDSQRQTPNYDIPSPKLTMTLDANNIWIGEKGVNSYDNMAKLDVYYDEDEDKWKARGGEGFKLEFIEENTVYNFVVPDWTPSLGDTVRTLINYTTVSLESKLQSYFIVIETEIRQWHYTEGWTTSKTYYTGFPGGSIDNSNLKFQVGSTYRYYLPDGMGGYFLEQYTSVDYHYKFYKAIPTIGDFGDRVII